MDTPIIIKPAHRQVDANQPWQIKAITTIGVTSVALLWLIYWGTSTLGPTVIAIKSTLDVHVADQMVIKGQNESIIRVLRASCVNQATTNADRERCFQ